MPIVARDEKKKNELQYLMVLQHWTVTHASMITLKYIRLSQMMMF